MTSEVMTKGPQSRAEAFEIVNFAIKDQNKSAAPGDHWLTTIL
jgi:hypothetical protein